MHKLLAICLGITVALCGLAHASSQQEKNKKLEKYAESHARNFVAHGGSRDYTIAEDAAAAKEERQAVPDLRMTVNHMVAEKDMVAVYWTASGTNTHEGMGFPATGKKIKTSGMTLFRFKAGKIIEEWSVWDELSVLKQTGLFPAQP